MSSDSIITKIVGKISRTITRGICFCIPIKKNKIVFDNFAGSGYGDSPKYIAEELLSRDLNLDLVWLTKDMDIECPNGIRKVKYQSILSIIEAGTAQVWVDNVRAAHLTKKKRKQLYLQTWHGSFSPKKIEKDAEENLLDKYVKRAKYDGRITDAIISNSYLLDEQYRRTFWLNENAEILKIGLPRNDIFFLTNLHGDIKKRVFKSLGVSSEEYIVLYAPTFRDNGSENGYAIPYERIRKSFEILTMKKCKLLIRFHPNVNVEKINFSFSPDIVDATFYPDLQELAIASDAVISDYSTAVFDFAIMKKPVFLHALDIDTYSKDRGLLPEYYDFPFPHTYNNDALIEEILNFSYDEYKKKVDMYFNAYPVYDFGTASKKAADWILSNMSKANN